jgi:hypothetical protein
VKFIKAPTKSTTSLKRQKKSQEENKENYTKASSHKFIRG